MLMMVLSATIISTSGLVVRSLETASDWQVVFWRGLSLSAGIFVILAFYHRRAVFSAFRTSGRMGVLGAVFYASALIFYVLAIANTSIANAVFTMSAVPFLTAILARLLLGERIGIAMALAIAVGMAGVALMVGDGIATDSIFGVVMALCAALSIAGFVIILRKGQNIDMLPTAIMGGLLSALAAIPMTQGKIGVSANDLVLCFMLGGVIASVGHTLFVYASRHLMGAELTLLGLIEFILGPVWVWVFINEEPSVTTLVGGAVVFSAIAGHTAFTLTVKRKPAPSTPVART